jgi:carboxymethylenebutenolidase
LNIPRRRGLSRCWALGALLLAAPMLHAQQGSKVHMHGGEGYAADGFLWEPSGIGNGGAVLIIHGAKGLTAYVRDEGQRLYSLGFVTIAVDLARGHASGDSAATTPPDRADNDALHDLKAALAFLRAQPNVRAAAIGLEGWGLGGLYALRLAGSDPAISAVAVTLAQSPDPTLLTDVQCALLVNLPRTTDARILLLAKEHGSAFKIYPDAEGDFFDPESLAVFRAGDADDARERTERFFGRELAP